MDFDLLSLTPISRSSSSSSSTLPPPLQFSVMHSVMNQLHLSIDPTLQLTPMLLETDRLCLEMFSNIPFESTPVLHHPEVFEAAVEEYAHHHLFDLFHTHNMNHFNSHAPSQDPPFPLRIDTSDLPPSSNDSNITQPLSNSPPQTPVFLPMSIVAPRLLKLDHICADDASALAGCSTVVAAEASPPQSPCDNTVKAENRLIDLVPSDRASRSSRISQRRHCKAINAASAQKRVECTLRKALSVPPESPVPKLCRKTSTSMSLSRNTDSEPSNSPCRKPRVGGTIKSQKNRYTLSEQQAKTLKACFEENRFLQPNQAAELAVKVGMSATQVKIWFQNRRAYSKRKGYRRKGTGNYSEDEVAEEDGVDWE
ncbi:hypothetical protein BJ741DRAFT_598019 [Chytriomyces cf. hyalinus JEL632]|nr:hypothetical protein BJ741DRAFT_598019 [Chytriomyces cf. hyalinus JEL632]